MVLQMKHMGFINNFGAVGNRLLCDKKAESLFTGCHGFSEMEPSVSCKPCGIFYRVVGLENMTDCGGRGKSVILGDLPFVNPRAGQPVNAFYSESEGNAGVVENACRRFMTINRRVSPIKIPGEI
jgi:hypothetical protein